MMNIPTPEEMIVLLGKASRLPLKQVKGLSQELEQAYKQCVRNPGGPDKPK